MDDLKAVFPNDYAEMLIVYYGTKPIMKCKSCNSNVADIRAEWERLKQREVDLDLHGSLEGSASAIYLLLEDPIRSFVKKKK